MAVGVHPCVGVRTGREVRRPTGERDEPVSCCSAIGARDQAPDPDAVGQRPGSLAFNTFFVFMPNHLAATKKLDLVTTLSITAAALAVTAAAAWALGRFDVAPGLYVSLVACLALVALRRWPETAFRATV
jgi:hypothetical protein